MKKTAKQIFWNALLLTAASLFCRTVSVGFGVYVSGVAGAEAMGLFSLTSGVYAFALTLATSGVQFGVTRCISEQIGRGQNDRVRAEMRAATLYALFFGMLAALGLLTLARPIGLGWLKDARTVKPLRLFAVSLPAIALSSVWNGYFTAVRRPYKNAFLQCGEQMIKIFFCTQLLTLFSKGGVESLCCALVAGGTLAEVGSFLVGLLLFLADRRKNFPRRAAEHFTGAGRRLLAITLPMALTSYARSGLMTLQQILIPEGLRKYGASHATALSEYGCLHGMALPVVLYPAALITAFSGLLIPTLTEADAADQPLRVRYVIARVWSLSLAFSIGVAGIAICFSGELGAILFPNTNAGYYIRLLAPLIPIMYIDTATDAMMKGLGEQVFCMNVNLADALISLLLVILLIPRYGIGGYLFATYFSELFNTTLSVWRLLRIKGIAVRLFKWVYKPLLSVVGATLMIRVIAGSVPVTGGGILALLCLLTLALYLLLLRLTGSLDGEDVRWITSLFSKNR